MTEKQQKMFSEILDLNWDMNKAETAVEQYDLALKLYKKKKELEDDMGAKAYKKFMNTGTEMFKPKTNDNGN